MITATVRRGCGRRVEGGVYLEVASGPNGSPLEHFIVDPPVPFTVDHKVGVEVTPGPDGKNHVIDWVGEQHYPWPSDVLEEGRCWGFSRRVPRSLDFSQLELGSRLLLVHAKAVLVNPEEVAPYLSRDQNLTFCCAKFSAFGNDAHLRDPSVACSRHWYSFAPPTGEGRLHAHYKTPIFERVLTESTRYRVYPATLDPLGPEPLWQSGVFASLPIGNIAVVKASDGSHQATLERIASTNPTLPVIEADA